MSNNDDIGNDSQLYNLSRRKVLAGMGAVGLASVGAGLGTSALFSDTESFEGNSITAGTLDMSVTASLVAANDYWANQIGLPFSVTSDGGYFIGNSETPVESFTFEVDDVKPGDWGIVCFEIVNETNPGYIQVLSSEGSNDDNGINDPEADAGDSTDGAGNGELQDAMLTTFWMDYDDTSGDRSGLSGLDDTTDNDAANNTPDQWSPSDLDGVVSGAGMHYTTLAEALATYSTGVTFRDGNGDPAAVGPAGQKFYVLFDLPAGVGNEIQSDSVSFDLTFLTEQQRNNPSPFDGDPNNGAPSP